MKAIIELGGRGSAIANARSQLAAAQAGQGIDYRLSFESARTLFMAP